MLEHHNCVNLCLVFGFQVFPRAITVDPPSRLASAPTTSGLAWGNQTKHSS